MKLALDLTLQSRALLGGGRAQTPMRQVTNRVMLPEERNASASWGKPETGHVLMDDVTGTIEVWWANYLATAGVTGPNGGATEPVPGVAATGTAQITYTDKTSGLPVTVGMVDSNNSASLTAPDGDYFKAFATINAAKGSRIFLRLRANFPNGVPFNLFRADTANGDLYEFGSSAPAALSVAPTNSFAGTWYGPSLIRARTNVLVAAILGDSRDCAMKDRPNTSRGDVGSFARLFGPADVAYVQVSAPGERAQEFVTGANSVRRRALIAAAGASFVAYALGTNDYIGGRSAAQAEADGQAIIASLALPKPAIWKTLSPYTVGNYTTPYANEAQRAAYNTLVRGKSVYFDAAAVLEDASIAGAWGSYYSVEPDMLHEVNQGNQWSAAQGQLVGVTVGNHGVAARAMGSRMSMPSNPVQANYISNQDVTNAFWNKSAVTPVKLYPDQPDNTLRETILNQGHSIINASAISRAAAVKTFIAFIDLERAGAKTNFLLQITDGGFTNGQALAFFTMAPTPANYFANQSGAWSAVVQRVSAIPGTSLYRYEVEFTTDAATTGLYYWQQLLQGTSTASYAGTITDGINVGKMWLYNKNAAAGGT